MENHAQRDHEDQRLREIRHAVAKPDNALLDSSRQHVLFVAPRVGKHTSTGFVSSPRSAPSEDQEARACVMLLASAATASANSRTAVQSVRSWSRMVSVGPPSFAAIQRMNQRDTSPYCV